MNKAAVLICELDNGDLTAIPETSILPLIDLSRKIRVTGVWKNKPVKSGMILASWKPMAQSRFIVDKSKVEAKREKE